jgi:hypothetical protein
VKSGAAQTRKKSANSNLFHNLRCEFDLHHHLRTEPGKNEKIVSVLTRTI